MKLNLLLYVIGCSALPDRWDRTGVQSVSYLAYIVCLPDIFADRYQLSAGRIGVSLLAMSSFTIVSIRIGSWLRNRLGNGFGLTAQLSLPALIGDVCLFGFAMGLTVSFPATILAEEFPEERATAIGVYNLVRYLGMASGGMWVDRIRGMLQSSSYLR